MAASAAIGSTQEPMSTIASRRTSSTRPTRRASGTANPSASGTQPTSSAGNATTMAKNEFQKPSTETSSMRTASRLPVIMRQAPRRYLWMSSAGGMSGEPVFQETLVDARQRLEIGERHAFVDHVHRLPDKAELDHRAMILDETRVRRSAGCREHRLAAGDGLDGRAQPGRQLLVAGEEDRAR